MKIKELIILAMTFAALLSACSNELDNREDIPLGGKQESEGSIILHLKGLSSQTRAALPGGTEEGIWEENRIHALELYIFNEDNSRDEKTPYQIIRGTGNAGEAGYYIDPATSITFGVTSGQKKKILAVANAGLGALSGQTYAGIRSSILSLPIENPLIHEAGGIPMSAEYTDIPVKEEEITRISLEMVRLRARFNAPTAQAPTVKITDEDYLKELATLLGIEKIEGNIAFALTGHHVINGLKKSYLFPQDATTGTDGRWDAHHWTLGNDVSNYFQTKYFTDGAYKGYPEEIYTGANGTDFLTNGEWAYIYENCPRRIQIHNLWGYDPASVYAFLIRGELWDTTDPDNRVTRYWRINVNKTDDIATTYTIERNSIYNLDIVNVRTIGHGTPEEAEEEKPIIPDVDEEAIETTLRVIPWEPHDMETDM